MLAVLLIFALPAHATWCTDGWHSKSYGPGTCSHHGGVYSYDDSQRPPPQVWLTAEELAAERDKNIADREQRELGHNILCTIVALLVFGVPAWIMYDEHKRKMAADAERATRPPPPPRPPRPPPWERDPKWKREKRRR